MSKYYRESVKKHYSQTRPLHRKNLSIHQMKRIPIPSCVNTTCEAMSVTAYSKIHTSFEFLPLNIDLMKQHSKLKMHKY